MKWNNPDMDAGIGQKNCVPIIAGTAVRNGVSLVRSEMYISDHLTTSFFTGDSTLCLLLLLKGRLQLKWNASRENATVEYGSLVLFPVSPNTSLELTLRKSHVKMLVWGFTHHFLSHPFLDKHAARFRISEPVTFSIPRPLEAYAEALFFKMNPPFDHLLPDIHLLNMLTGLMAIPEENAEIRSMFNEADLIQRCIHFIENSIPGEFSLKEMCLQANASESTIRRAFVRESGMRLQDYIRQIKVRKSQQMLLQEPVLEIKDVAYLLGFSSPSQFSVFIRRNLGVSPSAYREKHLRPD